MSKQSLFRNVRSLQLSKINKCICINILKRKIIYPSMKRKQNSTTNICILPKSRIREKHLGIAIRIVRLLTEAMKLCVWREKKQHSFLSPGSPIKGARLLNCLGLIL